jgi:hypothetical protein
VADKAAAKPKKKPFMTVGVPGARRTLGGGTTGGGGAVFQPNLLGAMQSKSPVGKTTPVSPTTTSSNRTSPGRPPSNIGNYLIKPTDTTITGYEMLNDTPDAIDAVHQRFKAAFELPTHLRPTRFLSPHLEHGRALNISRGFRNPRSRHG